MDEQLTLTSALDRWELTLRSGETLVIWAHGVKEDGDRYVFVALMRGEPHFEVEVSSVPMAMVVELVGG